MSKNISWKFGSLATLTLLLSSNALAATSAIGASRFAGDKSAPTHLDSALQMMLINQNLCVSYLYDKNSNRTAQTSTAIVLTGPKWGSSSYLCFTWSAN